MEMTYTPHGAVMDLDATLDQIEALMRTLPDRVDVAVRGEYTDRPCITLHNCPGSEYGWVHGYGATLRDAYADALAKRDEAAQNLAKLRTAKEMRDAVLAIVPDECRAAIEALPVAA